MRKREHRKKTADCRRLNRSVPIYDPDEALDQLATLCRHAGRLLSPRELDVQSAATKTIRRSFWLREIRWAEVQQRLLERHPDVLLHAGLVTRDGRIMKSKPEAAVLNAILAVRPKPRIVTYMRLGQTASYETDMVVNECVLVEVTLVPQDPAADDQMRANYRTRFGWKLRFYKNILGRMPVIFWAEDVADPVRMARRVAEIEQVLQASPPPLWGPINTHADKA